METNNPNITPDVSTSGKKPWYKRLGQKFANMSKQTKLTLAIGTPVLAGLITTTALCIVYANRRGTGEELTSLNVKLNNPTKNVNTVLESSDLTVTVKNASGIETEIGAGGSGYSIEPALGTKFTESGKTVDLTITYKGLSQKTGIYIKESVTPTSYCTVTFDVGDGSVASGETTIQVVQGCEFKTISKPSVVAPASVGTTYYMFGGWKYNDTVLTDSDIINSNMTLSAVWVAKEGTLKHTVTFDLSGGAVLKTGSSTISVENGTKWADVSKPYITKEGYSISSYMIEDASVQAGVKELTDDFVFSNPQSKNYVVYISWISNPTPVQQCTVTFNTENGIWAGNESVAVDKNTWLSKLNRPMVKSYEDTTNKYVHNGLWSTEKGGEAIDPDYEFKEDVQLYAKYDPQEKGSYGGIKVIFDSGDHGHFSEDEGETGTNLNYTRTFYPTDTTKRVERMTFEEFLSTDKSDFKEKTALPTLITDEDYNFTGWSISKDQYIYEGTVVAVAQYASTTPTISNVVSFTTSDSSKTYSWEGSRSVILHDNETKFGDIEKPTVSCNGMLFVGWLNENDEPIGDNDIINSSFVAKAKFILPDNYCYIYFEHDDHSQFDDPGVEQIEVARKIAGTTWKNKDADLVPNVTPDEKWEGLGWYDKATGRKIDDSFIFPDGEIHLIYKTQSKLVADTWGDLAAAANRGEDVFNDAYGFKKIDECFGLEKTVKLNGIPHKVRIVDSGHDKTAKGNTTLLTFEFVTPICGSDGKSLSLMWQYGAEPGEAKYYVESDIYQALIMPEDVKDDILWFTHGGYYNSSDYTSTVMGMLKDDKKGTRALYDLIADDLVLKKFNNGASQEDYSVPLYLPTAWELGFEDVKPMSSDDTRFKWYWDSKKEKPLRSDADYVKRQYDNSYVSAEHTRIYMYWKTWEAAFSKTIRKSAAGVNVNKTDNGVEYWLGSFSFDVEYPDVILWSGILDGKSYNYNEYALPIAPCFSIGKK